MNESIENIQFNTGETNRELREKYNPEGSTLRKFQYRMLDMLLYLDKVCKEQGITWYLDGGNVLGAVRHGGFIPWDDDVDVVLTPKDHKRLTKYLLEHPHPQYVLQCKKTDKGYYSHGWVVLRDLKSEYIQDSNLHNARKYRGAQIDIFRYENHVNRALSIVSNLSMRVNIKFFIGRSHLVAQSIYWFQKFFFLPLLKVIGYCFSSKKLYAHTMGSLFNEWWIPENVLYPTKPILFEGHYFPGPARVDDFLKIKFGDNYMNLPPIDKRDKHQAKYKIWD